MSTNQINSSSKKRPADTPLEKDSVKRRKVENDSDHESTGPDEDTKVQWKSLEHHGVTFPPAYERLPDHVFLKVKATN